MGSELVQKIVANMSSKLEGTSVHTETEVANICAIRIPGVVKLWISKTLLDVQNGLQFLDP
jgi:hypothetical protein